MCVHQKLRTSFKTKMDVNIIAHDVEICSDLAHNFVALKDCTSYSPQQRQQSDARTTT